MTNRIGFDEALAAVASLSAELPRGLWAMAAVRLATIKRAIENGATELAELRQAQPQGWVACSERMPEQGRAVLFSNPLWAEPELGRLVDDGWELDDETRYYLHEVKFWHALPESPEVSR